MMVRICNNQCCFVAINSMDVINSFCFQFFECCVDRFILRCSNYRYETIKISNTYIQTGKEEEGRIKQNIYRVKVLMIYIIYG
jgi:hypothetical protein